MGGASAFFHVYPSEEYGAGDNDDEDGCHGGSRVEEGCGEDVEDWAQDGGGAAHESEKGEEFSAAGGRGYLGE